MMMHVLLVKETGPIRIGSNPAGENIFLPDSVGSFGTVAVQSSCLGEFAKLR